jgi:hypothetical protein
MTRYHVHLIREMHLTFDCVEADTPQAAAALAAGKPAGEAGAIEDCGGANVAATVTIAGDGTFGRAVTVDFAVERLREATPGLLALSRRVVQARAAGEAVAERLYVAAVLLLSALEDSLPPGDGDDA